MLGIVNAAECRSMKWNRQGFTLIELLVVITIIVVLLALLTPALDSALYQAELAQCATSQDGVVNGALLYAMDHKRTYPNRPGNLEDTNTTSYEPYKLVNKQQGNNPIERRDLRPIIMEYIGDGLWSCPFSSGVSLVEPDTRNSQNVFASFNFWFGWQYAGHGKMMKVGHKWAWTWRGETARFNALVSDVDFAKQNETFAFASHPDKAGAMSLSISKDQPMFVVLGNATGAFYSKGNDAVMRGDLDMHVGYEDGSIQRFLDVPFRDDPRMVRLPLHDNPFTYGTGDNEWLHMPRQ